MIRTRNIDPLTPARAVSTKDSYLIRVLPTDADCFATSQALSATELTLALDGAFMVNPFKSDATSETTIGTLLLPSDLWFTASAGNVVITGIVKGWDHLGNQVYFEFSKSAAQTVFTLAQSSQVTITKNGDVSQGINAHSPYCCFSAIEYIKLTAASAVNITVGTFYTNTVAARQIRIPLPVPIASLTTSAADLTEIGDSVFVNSVGGATVTAPAAVPGYATPSTSIFGSNDLLLMTNATLNETVAGTTFYEFIVTYRGGRNVAK